MDPSSQQPNTPAPEQTTVQPIPEQQNAQPQISTTPVQETIPTSTPTHTEPQKPSLTTQITNTIKHSLIPAKFQKHDPVEDWNASFEKFVAKSKEKVMQRIQAEENHCMKSHDVPENYAKCMYAFHKDLKDTMSTLSFQTDFVKKKTAMCIQAAGSKPNKEDEIKECIRNSQVNIDRLLNAIPSKK